MDANEGNSTRKSVLIEPRKMYPSKDELSTVNTHLVCTEPDCNIIFRSESNLNLHLSKTHKILIKSMEGHHKSEELHFHCPETDCTYNGTQYFKTKTLLKQHYLKVHAPKSWICKNCNKGFPTMNFQKKHTEYCGVVFKCSTCKLSYPSYETLKTHARRKGHSVQQKSFFRIDNLTQKNRVLSLSKSDINLNSKSLPMVVPKPSTSLVLIFVPINENQFDKNDQSIQTECRQPKLKSKFTQLKSDTSNLQNTQHTQTLGSKKIQLTVETQTIGDYFNKKCLLTGVDLEYEKKDNKTQTKSISSKTSSCNTSFTLSDFECGDVQRSCSSTQTMGIKMEPDFIYSSTNTSTHDSIHTDTSDLLDGNIDSNMDAFDPNFFNCNMETQTDFMFDDELLNYCDDYSNMYTQTCEDTWLNGLGLNNIETQTMDEMLRSVESQTNMSHKKMPISCRDMSHMETQTDMEFKQMLEEINA